MALSLSLVNRFRLYLLPSSTVRYYTDQVIPAEEKQETKTQVNWKEKREYERFGHAMWKPKKRLTRYQMDHLRELHRDFPTEWTLTKLSKHFAISHSAIKRILRSKFEPSEEIKSRQDTRVQESRDVKKKNMSSNTKADAKNN